ncbi:NfeD family protein [Roseisolibacter sp. H3M3-2]|uniref:NfeD family protein n=1 Tax=Roseisolibacter sp. H3M3-2 TaxID=3031323 RepID=UPI0023DB815D|nr:NfeD family protein [Roseisolibacter sp. H3M3-2]MDF1505936.1 NfeD family protein [Roseisolibacter sp. H3M3-2]
MTVVFAACFVLGLLLAVHVMLHGVERAAPPAGGAPHELSAGHDPRTEPSPWLNRQNVAAFVTAFGVTGYAVQRLTTLGAPAAVGLALAGGAAAAALSLGLLAGWALPSVRREVPDDRYVLQGHPATVTREIAADAEGEIAYEADGRTWTVRARSWDGAPMGAGTEVAIERVEDGVAFVEAWAQVEARL